MPAHKGWQLSPALPNVHVYDAGKPVNVISKCITYVAVT